MADTHDDDDAPRGKWVRSVWLALVGRPVHLWLGPRGP